METLRRVDSNGYLGSTFPDERDLETLRKVALANAMKDLQQPDGLGLCIDGSDRIVQKHDDSSSPVSLRFARADVDVDDFVTSETKDDCTETDTSARSRQCANTEAHSQYPPKSAPNFMPSYGLVSDEGEPPKQQQPSATAKVKKSSLKKSSSYGELEELGSNIPIISDRKVWRALPAPCEASSREQIPKLPTRKPSLFSSMIPKVRRSTSNPDISGDESFRNQEPSHDNTSSASCSDFPDDEEIKAPRKNVSFSQLEIRQYNVTVGDNPSCSAGPPVTLDWTHGNEIFVNVHDYESHKERNPATRRQHHQMRLSAVQRSMWLRQEFEATADDLRKASDEVRKIRLQRLETNKSVGKSSSLEDKFAESWDKVGRKAKKVFKDAILFGASDGGMRRSRSDGGLDSLDPVLACDC